MTNVLGGVPVYEIQMKNGSPRFAVINTASTGTFGSDHFAWRVIVC